MSDGAAARAGAARALVAVLNEGRSLRLALAPELSRLPDARDRALLEAIAFATLRGLRRYQALLPRLLEKPLPKQKAAVNALLLAGFAQLDALGMPPYAAISATAEAARSLNQPRFVGLVNAVLRRCSREREILLAALELESAAAAHPDWLARALREAWGAEAEAVMQANLVEAPLWLRINPLRTSRDAYLTALAEAGVEAEPVAQLPQALRCARRLPPTSLPGWEQGLVSVQDGAAQAAVEALEARSGERVLDACAAPGGKTAHLLERAAGQLDLQAVERDAARLPRVAETLQRLGLAATLHAADAADAGWWDGLPFDRILIDAPCSATGIIRRQPDILLHRRASDIPPLLVAQRRLLDALWPRLRPGGRLVYATCSVLPDENARQIDAFLQRHPDAVALPAPLPLGRASGAGFQRLPGEDGMDGFFVALLERRA
jgi:16S rRNA (cytosine967-C5)-methyltransferase